MKEKVQELLGTGVSSEMELALSILFLKYKMALEEYKNSSRIDYHSHLDTERGYEEKIKELEDYYSISIDGDNLFTHEVIKSLENEYLIDISDDVGNKGFVKIVVPDGINHLRKLYDLTNESEEKLSNTIVYNIVNNVNIHIGDTINNVTQGMSEGDKKEFIELLKEYPQKKKDKTFLKKLGDFSKRVSEGVLISFIANLTNPANLPIILESINL